MPDPPRRRRCGSALGREGAPVEGPAGSRRVTMPAGVVGSDKDPMRRARSPRRAAAMLHGAVRRSFRERRHDRTDLPSTTTVGRRALRHRRPGRRREKITLLTDLAKEFNDSEAEADGQCVFVRPRREASGGAAQLLAAAGRTPRSTVLQPVIWSPASAGWAIVNQRRTTAGSWRRRGQPAVHAHARWSSPCPSRWPRHSTTRTPGRLPRHRRAGQRPRGVGCPGPPRVGTVPPRQDQPQLLHQRTELHHRRVLRRDGQDLRAHLEDLARPTRSTSPRASRTPSCTTATPPSRSSTTGTPPTLGARRSRTRSAVAVEEKSVLDYNAGNPDGVLEPGEVAQPPAVPPGGHLPREGTLFSDNPFSCWTPRGSAPTRGRPRARFSRVRHRAREPEGVLEFKFRPGNPSVPVAAPDRRRERRRSRTSRRPCSRSRAPT